MVEIYEIHLQISDFPLFNVLSKHILDEKNINIAPTRGLQYIWKKKPILVVKYIQEQWESEALKHLVFGLRNIPCIKVFRTRTGQGSDRDQTKNQVEKQVD